LFSFGSSASQHQNATHPAHHASTIAANTSLNFFYEHKSWSEGSDRSLRRRNLLVFVLACVGILIMVLSNIVNFQWWYSDTTNKLIYDTQARGPELVFLRIVFQAMKCVNVIVTILTLLALMNYYRYYSWVKKQRWGYLSRWSAFFKTSLLRKFVVEFLVLAITPVPFVESWYSFDFGRSFLHKLDLLMFLRLYLVVRVVRDYSTVYRKRTKIIVANLDYKKFLPEFGWKLSFQMLFYHHTLAMLFMMAVSTTLIATFCIWIAERDTDNKALATFYNALYFSLVTQMTIGYGDIVPTKTYGRLTALGQGLLGIVLVSIFSGVVINKLTPTDQQKAAVHYLKREKYMKLRLTEAVRILQVEWLYRKKKCSLNYRHNKVRTSTRRIQGLRRQLLKLEQQSNANTLGDLLKRQQELRNSVHHLSKTLQEVHELVRLRAGVQRSDTGGSELQRDQGESVSDVGMNLVADESVAEPDSASAASQQSSKESAAHETTAQEMELLHMDMPESVQDNSL